MAACIGAAPPNQVIAKLTQTSPRTGLLNPLGSVRVVALEEGDSFTPAKLPQGQKRRHQPVTFSCSGICLAHLYRYQLNSLWLSWHGKRYMCWQSIGKSQECLSGTRATCCVWGLIRCSFIITVHSRSASHLDNIERKTTLKHPSSPFLNLPSWTLTGEAKSKLN